MKKQKYLSTHEASKKRKLRWTGKVAITALLAIAPLLQSVAEFPLAPATVHAVTTAAPTSTYNPAKDNVAADEAAIPAQPTRPNLSAIMQAPTDALSNFGTTKTVQSMSSFNASGMGAYNATTGALIKNEANSAAGLMAAVYDIYNTAKSASTAQDYILYVGSSVAMPGLMVGSNVVGLTDYYVVPTPSATAMTFTTLSTVASKISSLTIVGTSSDTNGSTATTATPYELQFPGSQFYLGCPTVFRNIGLRNTNSNNNATTPAQFNLAADGYPVIFNSGTVFNTATQGVGGANGSSQVYQFAGGTLSGNGNVNEIPPAGANPLAGATGTNLYFNSTSTNSATSSALLILAGGSDNGNTITGDTHVTVNQTGTSTISYLIGGSLKGNITGNSNLHLINANCKISTLIGGSGSAGAGTTTGNVYNLINSSNPNTVYALYYGGAGQGSIVNGTVYNNFEGQGSFATGTVYWIGGARANGTSTIGTAGNNGYAIVNNIDISQFSNVNNVNVPFTGGMQGNGTVNGGILNYLKAGTNGTPSASSGTAAFGTVYGGNGASATALDWNGMSTGTSSAGSTVGSLTNVANYMNLPEGTATSTTTGTRAGDAYTAAQSRVVGGTQGIYTYLEGGLFNSASYGGSYAGYVQGNTALEIGNATTAPGYDGNLSENGATDGSRSLTTGIGGSGMVSAATWMTNNGASFSATNDPNQNSALSFYSGNGPGGSNFSVGNIQNTTVGAYQIGNAAIITNNAIFRSAYAADGGVLDGSSCDYNNGGVIQQQISSSSNTLYQSGNAYNLMQNGRDVLTMHGQTGFYLGSPSHPVSMINFISGGYVNGYIDAGYSVSSTPTYDSTSGLWNGMTNYANSSLDITGGNITGTTTGNGGPSISAGTEYGALVGNATVNITGLSQPLGSNVVLSGGGSTHDMTNVAAPESGSTATINVNIDLPSGTNWFNGNNVYGDITGGTNTNVGSINMNIQAPGSTFGTIAPTNYAMGTVKNYNNATIASQTNTATMIGDGITFNTLSGGGTADNFTNTATTHPTSATLLLGDGSNAGAISSMNTIENFTALNVNNGAWTGAPSGSLDTNTAGTDSALTLNIGGNGILNGSGVTAANHYNTYNQSGNLTVGNGATLNEDYGNGTTPANAPISVANATLGAGDILQQAYTTNTGLFNLSNLSMPTGATLQWQPQGSAPSLNDTSATSTELGEFGFGADTQYKNDSTTSSLYNGDYQGKQLGYPVLTFTGGSGYTTSDTEGIVEPGTANVPQNSTNSNFFSTATAWGKSLYGDIDNSLALDSSQVSNLGVSANQAEVAVMSPTGTVTMAAPNLDFGYYPAYVAVNTAGKIDPNSTHANSEYGAPTNANATQNLESYNTIFSKWIGIGYKLQAEFTTPLMNGNSQLLNVSYWSNSSGSSAQSMSGVTANIAGYKSFGYDNIAGTGANLGTPDQTWVNTNSTSSPTTNTQGTGINLTVPANTASNGAYTGTMTWSVVNAPA